MGNLWRSLLKARHNDDAAPHKGKDATQPQLRTRRQHHTNFFNLPRELRDEIYVLALQIDGRLRKFTLMPVLKYARPRRDSTTLVKANLHSLQHVDKLVRKEAEVAFYSSFIFVFDVEALRIWDRLCNGIDIARIRKFEFTGSSWSRAGRLTASVHVVANESLYTLWWSQDTGEGNEGVRREVFEAELVKVFRGKAAGKLLTWRERYGGSHVALDVALSTTG